MFSYYYSVRIIMHRQALSSIVSYLSSFCNVLTMAMTDII
nr:MAG TPA: hypothetical protein [Caudoviricetes sp.]